MRAFATCGTGQLILSIEGLGPYRGHDDVRRWCAEALEILPDLNVELDEVRDLGNMKSETEALEAAAL
jgi:hypothetical protein